MESLAARIEVLERAAREGGAIAAETFRSELLVETKETPMDAVTDVDREVQRHVVGVIEESFPGEPIVAEEEDALKTIPDSGPAWVVDPIDGTNNYVAGNRTWGTAVAAVSDGDPVAGVNHFPVVGDTYRTTPVGIARNDERASVSERSDLSTCTAGTIFGLQRTHRDALASVARRLVTELGDYRRYGSSQATLSMVAAGELDAAVSTVTLPPWDTVAGAHLVRQAGGRVTDLKGEPWCHDSQGLLASNGHVHASLVEAFGSD